MRGGSVATVDGPYKCPYATNWTLDKLNGSRAIKSRVITSYSIHYTKLYEFDNPFYDGQPNTRPLPDFFTGRQSLKNFENLLIIIFLDTDTVVPNKKSYNFV